MGSKYKRNPGKRKRRWKKGMIVYVLNSHQWAIKYALIIFEDNGYRLIIIYSSEKRIDKSYKTLKGAKCAYGKFNKSQEKNRGLRPSWSYPYPPEKSWLDKMMSATTIND